MPILLCIQIGLINLENEDFVKKIVEQTHTNFQVSDFADQMVEVFSFHVPFGLSIQFF